MATFNAKIVASQADAVTGVIRTTIELRAVATDPDPVRTFGFNLTAQEALADVRTRAKAAAIAEWNEYLKALDRQSKIDTLAAGLVGQSYNIKT